MEALPGGWGRTPAVAGGHVKQGGETAQQKGGKVLINFITPAILIVVIGFALYSEFSGNYGDYSTKALLVLGVGWLLAALVISVILMRYPWSGAKLSHDHQPEEDHLLV